MSYVGIYLEHSQKLGDYDVSPPKSTPRSRIRDATSLEHVLPLPSSDSLSLDEYVLPWGFCHLSYVNPRNRAVLRAIATLRSSAQRHPLQWDQLCRRSGYVWPTLKHDFVLFILIAFAPAQLLRLFIGRAQLKWKDGTNPLVYAARCGTIEHARILLASGVSLHQRGRDLDVYLNCQVLPLEAAASNGDFHMVDIFLGEGSPVPYKLLTEALKSPGLFPARTVSKLLQTDEFVEWAAEVQDEGLLLRPFDPTHYANHPAHKLSQLDIDAIQRRITQIGCDPSARFNETSLRLAVFAGHILDVQHMLSLGIQLPADILLDASNAEMIHFCLGTGSDIHTLLFTEDSAMHRLMIRGNLDEEELLESIQVLIDAGCNPSTFNLAGRTPLHFAVEYGYFSIAEHLLALQVPLPLDVLLAVSQPCKSSMIRLLTTKGGDVHAIAANGDTPLHRVLDHQWADSEEQLNCIKILISSGCSPHLRNAYGKTPLDIATENSSLLIVQYLHGTLNSSLPSDILFSAVGGYYLDATPVIRFLIDMGATIQATHPSGDTLLHLAIMALPMDSEMECLKRVKLLVSAGCDPIARNQAGETPFHMAAMQGHVLVMEYLLSLGISPPIDVMLTQFEWDPADGERYHYSICFLLDRGGDIHAIAKNGDTLLHLAANLFPEEDALRLAKQVVDAGCMPCALNSKQETPLHVAARCGYTSVIRYLLSLNIAFPPDILVAASTGYSTKAPSIRYLVEQGAVVSAVTTEGDTPLHLLLTMGDEHDRLECVKILLDAGCNPCARNSAGETPLHAAARHGFCKILAYLISQGVPPSQDILLASQTVATLRFFLGKGHDLRSVAANDVTELMHRVLDSHPGQDPDPVEFARILIAGTLDVWDPSMKNSTGETVIHVAARNLNIHAVKFFLSQNVPLPSDVLLAVMSRFNDPENYIAVCLTTFLIHEGASVNVAASNGDTPLHLAIKHGFTSDDDMFMFFERESWRLVEILLNSGSDPSARNADGETPYSFAEAEGHFFNQNFLRLVHNSRAHRLPS